MLELIPRVKIKNYKNQPVLFAHEKLDGHMVEIYRDHDVVVHRKKRNEGLWLKLRRHDVIRRQIESLPSGSIIQAEMHIPGQAASLVPTYLNEANPGLEIIPFAIHTWCRKKYTGTIAQAEGLLQDYGWGVPDRVDLYNEPMHLTEEGVKSLLASARKRKIEGWVVKASQIPDAFGAGWYKIKPTKTVDGVVLRVYTSTSDSYAGGLKAIEIGVYAEDGTMVEIASVGSGFEAAYRMNTYLPSLVGRVAEVEYDCVAGQGRLRFPRFVRWRGDKPAHQCTIDQLE